MNAAVSRMRARIAEYLPYLAWVSFVLALTGGVLLPGTKFGNELSGWVESVTWPVVPALVLCVLVFGAGYDILRDAIPDRMAVYTAAVAPTIAGSVDGGIADAVGDFSNWVAGWSVDHLEKLTALYSQGALSLFCLGMALVIAQRTMKDKRAGARGHGGGGH